MLLLGREVGESVVLFDPQGERVATVMVTELRGKTAVLGILAPPAMRIVRHELLVDGVTKNGNGNK